MGWEGMECLQPAATAEATDLFQERRQKHSEALLRVKELLVNFKKEFQGQDGTTKHGVLWQPLTAFCQEMHKWGEGVGAAWVMSQLLDPTCVPPAQAPKPGAALLHCSCALGFLTYLAPLACTFDQKYQASGCMYTWTSHECLAKYDLNS